LGWLAHLLGLDRAVIGNLFTLNSLVLMRDAVRRHQVFLTPKGRALAERIDRFLGNSVKGG
jgi:hypothetical protein